MTHFSTTLEEGASNRGAGEIPLAPHLFLVLECDRPLARGARYSTSGLDTVSLGREPTRGARRSDVRTLEIGVPDGWMSRRHARIEHALNRWIVEDLGSRNGTFLNRKRIERAELSDGDVLELGHTFFVFRDGLPTPGHVPHDVDAAESEHAADGLATLLPALAADVDNLGRIARAPIEVLIRGETGTGKELFARAIHRRSGRTGPFVAINCGAIPATLVESELFGHEKGSFSGADRAKQGLIRSAHGGTLFLDEIGDLAAESQAALLRALQEREVLPVGGTKPVPVDIRLVSATHHDLEEETRRGAFRDDLLGRLAAQVIHLPALRERREDLGILLASLLPRISGDRNPPAIAPDTARLLLEHPFPRNIRQLEKALTVALSLVDDAIISPEHLPSEIRTPPAGEAAEGSPPGRNSAASAAPTAKPPLSAADQTRRDEVDALLREHRGNVSAVARAMGKGRTQIQRWISRYGLDPDAYRAG